MCWSKFFISFVLFCSLVLLEQFLHTWNVLTQHHINWSLDCCCNLIYCFLSSKPRWQVYKRELYALSIFKRSFCKEIFKFSVYQLMLLLKTNRRTLSLTKCSEMRKWLYWKLNKINSSYCKRKKSCNFYSWLRFHFILYEEVFPLILSNFVE